jgi:hypothetical protein
LLSNAPTSGSFSMIVLMVVLPRLDQLSLLLGRHRRVNTVRMIGKERDAILSARSPLGARHVVTIVKTPRAMTPHADRAAVTMVTT